MKKEYFEGRLYIANAAYAQRLDSARFRRNAEKEAIFVRVLRNAGKLGMSVPAA